MLDHTEARSRRRPSEVAGNDDVMQRRRWREEAKRAPRAIGQRRRWARAKARAERTRTGAEVVVRWGGGGVDLTDERRRAPTGRRKGKAKVAAGWVAALERERERERAEREGAEGSR